jgi:two-component sensor histidine kinase
MILMVALLLFAYSLLLKPRRPEVASWAIAYGLLMTGAVLTVLRGIIPDAVSIILGNLAILSSYIALRVGVFYFRERPIRWWLIAGGLVFILLWFGYFTLVSPSFAVRFYSYNSGIMAICLWTAFNLMQSPEPGLVAVSGMTATLLSLSALLSLLRMMAGALLGLPPDLMSGGYPDSLIQALQCALACVLGFSFLLLRTEKLNVQAELKEREIGESLHEKEVLLKEIHHRVKNNLQVISSLINLRLATSSNSEARNLLADIDRKVGAMALAHEQLYESPSLSTIRMEAYLRLLVGTYRDAYAEGECAIEYRVDAGDVLLPIELAMPIGLIVGELVANAQRHAFGGRAGGRVDILLERSGKELRLTVRDDGNGFAAAPDDATPRKLGHLLVQSLAAQLQGELCLSSGNGLTVCVDRIPDGSP